MKIRNANHVYKSVLDNSEKFAIWITDKVGTIGFFTIIFFWTIFWLGWNMFGPTGLRFDPYPAFVLWLFLSNMIQIFLMPLIMVGQNLQSKHSEIRAETDFEVNMKAQKEVEELKQELDEIKSLLQKILSEQNK
ncbi:MAG TPA: DUF1003 domain-containing protein [Ignavibacteriaceae bacterium]|jgi:uncharacterized membrane protein|nr:MAG: hypothetical protein BWY38_02519 [Ignavibacteria bacterium ADurb.Bin266]OQY70563.1 MAG: hypothetical protein B6D44_15555 [Ignavibacteriales bacterium UTCHB2]HQF43497.1 DUF1003 domain-containing protein [Ignavibacteriaceae bacterium]HQI42046.1 DUF1003 domain-containing protein [Ignavibacteriaceae bacterium]